MMKKVSVCIIAYNHEGFIAECIESIVSQKADFDFEVIIGEDKSTDNTLLICKEYQEKYPEMIRVIERESNVGMLANWFDTIKEAKTEYLALCEGDDYWIDKYKLQKSFEILKNNPKYSIVTSNVVELSNNSDFKKYDWRWDKKRNVFKFEDYLYQLFFHTSTVMFKKVSLPDFLYNKELIQADIPLFLLILLKGDLYHLNEFTSVYRRHEGGITNSVQNKNDLKKIKSIKVICENINRYSDYKYSKYFYLKNKIELYIYKYNKTKQNRFKITYRFFKLLFLINLMFKKNV
ncbi:glycosyltransferase family 2 protein [Tenacibaculum halocynthiae]|uniref:glycosyltransferase family 2 protein n=1 Tax=Tenacibaculum halocynthiae TaxID=1254437 RepID=UPI0038934393